LPKSAAMIPAGVAAARNGKNATIRKPNNKKLD